MIFCITPNPILTNSLFVVEKREDDVLSTFTTFFSLLSPLFTRGVKRWVDWGMGGKLKSILLMFFFHLILDFLFYVFIAEDAGKRI